MASSSRATINFGRVDTDQRPGMQLVRDLGIVTEGIPGVFYIEGGVGRPGRKAPLKIMAADIDFTVSEMMVAIEKFDPSILNEL